MEKCNEKETKVKVRGVGYPLYDCARLGVFLLFIVVSKPELAFFQYKSFIFSIEHYQLNVHRLGKEKLSEFLACNIVGDLLRPVLKVN